MEGKVFWGKYLICVMLLLGQLHGYQSCVEKERNALLQLKKYLVSITREVFVDDVLPTWTNDTKSNCCGWDGLRCNLTSGRVTEIAFDLNSKDNSLFNLSLLHPFEDVRSLNFSGSFLRGLFDDVEGYKSLRRLRNLEILDLSWNNFNNSIFPLLNAATSLTTLFLRGNNMVDPFPVKELKDLTNLELLDLSENSYNGSIPVREITSLRKLKALDLSDNEFSGSMDLQGICKLKNMQELDLSHNKLVGQFPLCLTSLTGLRVLDLSSNQLTGEIPSALGNLESLEYLSLLDNDFDGFFLLDWLAKLSELKVLKLGSKSNSFQVDSKSSWKPKFRLNAIVLRSCNLEIVPRFLLQQKGLNYVDLSDNKISENFPFWLLANNTELEVLLLKNNILTSFQLPESAHDLRSLDVSVNEFNHMFPENIGLILPHLRYMNISKNGFQGNLPSSLGNMSRIDTLDVSHNSFQGKLPRSLVKGCYNLAYLKLSHNKLSGEVFPESAELYDLRWLYMDNNQFTGNIGQGLQNLTFLHILDISNNNLTGVIPSWVGELPRLYAILLSNNSLEGEIPTSLFNKTFLLLLDLSANSLSGGLPPHVDSTLPVILLLQDNHLSGDIPDTLLANVSILDLRNNRLSGNIPEFINTQSISVLLLRGNNLTGHVPRQLCGLRNIQLLDLANNRLNGSIPSCLSNTSFGLGKEDNAFHVSNLDLGIERVYDDPDRYFKPLLIELDPLYWQIAVATQTKVEFATKHRYDAYMVGGILKYLFGLDLSENELSGEIPIELGGLLEIQAFNLSHNNLSGVIPDSFSGLKNVESLDLSFNRLQGRIPSRLADLSSLAVFNVSYNNLSGVTPQGRQFNTFDMQSYLGNPLLCGKSTNTTCDSNIIHAPDNVVKDEESTIDMVSFYWSFAAAYVTILLGIFASLSFDSPWSRFWFYKVDVFIHKARNLLW
ncbi:probable LRR receptor-like serine/threonine-protein kinase At4g36180 isoform X3 [Eutrema salsugineum]|uniref:probable LRR receptor-like serine/threonine-protein kinase At4g36180 isoform X3 n=1 Tax=Eutrema salsugineum TaxID=72664 RepID=UPI000CECF259|nr:probable LRR receptor-like serine/threonine-protein kinase At4g36180 isoform X3 [Eutrema salsugineum]